VALAFLLSWAAWLPLLAAVQGWLPIQPWPALHLVGGLGPGIAAVVVIGVAQGRAGLGRLGSRLLAWRGRRSAWAFALLVPPLLLFVAAPLSVWASGRPRSGLDWSAFGASTEFASLPLGAWWIVNLVFFGLGEEVGWRGFLQPQLQGHHSLLVAAGLVSVPWALWHLPLFGISPSYRAMPLIGFVGFAASIWVASLIFAWLLQLGRGSLLIVVVFHAWFDIVTTSPLGPPALPMMMGAAITVLGLVLLWSMRRQSATPDVGRPSSGKRGHWSLAASRR
jgi:membrane protease YdiL (CAAX protease family)